MGSAEVRKEGCVCPLRLNESECLALTGHGSCPLGVISIVTALSKREIATSVRKHANLGHRPHHHRSFDPCPYIL